MIDTHCHIHDFSAYKYVCGTKGVEAKEFTPEKLAGRAWGRGVSGVICIGTTMEDSGRARDFAEMYSGDGGSRRDDANDKLRIFWAYGIHPDESEKMTEASFEEIEKDFLAAKNPPVAIGEIGLDFHRISGEEEAQQQIALLRKMLKLAKKYQLPVIFHIREAFPEFFRVVDSEEFQGITGVVHSFSDSEEVIRECLERGFYIGMGGIATFRKEAPLPPLKRILLETDAPFLTPVPHRKEVNEPYYARATAEFLAERYGVSAEEIIARADENAERVFSLPI